MLTHRARMPDRKSENAEEDVTLWTRVGMSHLPADIVFQSMLLIDKSNARECPRVTDPTRCPGARLQHEIRCLDGTGNAYVACSTSSKPQLN